MHVCGVSTHLAYIWEYINNLCLRAGDGDEDVVAYCVCKDALIDYLLSGGDYSVVIV